jgi:hypothetical protein
MALPNGGQYSTRTRMGFSRRVRPVATRRPYPTKTTKAGGVLLRLKKKTSVFQLGSTRPENRLGKFGVRWVFGFFLEGQSL